MHGENNLAVNLRPDEDLDKQRKVDTVCDFLLTTEVWYKQSRLMFILNKLSYYTLIDTKHFKQEIGVRYSLILMSELW